MSVGRVGGSPDFSYTAEQQARLKEHFEMVEAKTITWLDPDKWVLNSDQHLPSKSDQPNR